MTDTRSRLVIEAGYLFQQKGYHGVGLSQILERAGVPKGSLYHYFPNGKADLALAAADVAATEVLRIIDASFETAKDYQEGVTTFCYKLAKYFDIHEGKIGCPVSATLLGGPDDAAFRDALKGIFEKWMARITAHAVRLGQPAPDAALNAQRLFLSLEGSWTLARAQRNADVIRNLPSLVC
ncbi:TetR/AcrR family transcriptional regulator [Roseobacter sp. CCS2]|uniref:TetR/AcrR family transcriptional regulator n=1 Tax=Roseobacter sp. CCS2 TaxID=391593 RepID=UPI0000F3E5EF|nr:TetR/AcrR family transcriptional regulator [Roseobacter sp. CCS2]EBA11078.1 transcriptional regulator, TetR family protein [Roseobacter sp. CCS2]